MIIDVDTVAGFWPIRRCDIGVERLQTLMARYGIHRACTCSARGIWYDDEEGNRETAEMAERYPNLIPMATIDPRKFSNSAAEIQRRVDAGCRIVRLFPEYQAWSPASPSASRILHLFDEAGVAIVIGGSTAEVLPAIKGLRVPVILAGAHFYQLADALAWADEMPNVYLSTRLLIGPGAINRAVSLLGANRLVFGSHAPLVYLASALRLVEAADLTPTQRESILSGNLLALLREGV